MENINTDYKEQTWKILAEVFKKTNREVTALISSHRTSFPLQVCVLVFAEIKNRSVEEASSQEMALWQSTKKLHMLEKLRRLHTYRH